VNAPPTACSECRTLIGGYVLDALDPLEADAVRRHIAECPDCAAEHARLAGLPSLLAIAGADDAAVEKPPAALEEAVLDRFAREHRAERAAAERPRRRGRLAGLLAPFRRPLPAAIAGAASAALATAAIALVLAGGDDGTAGNTYQAQLTGGPSAPAARAFAKLESSSSGTNVHLSVRGLSARPGDVFELWCIGDDGTKISAGTFRVDGGGHAYAVLTTAAVPGQYHRMSIERRALARDVSGERVMTGEIEYSRPS
jgi:hypothetical protein